MTRKRYMKLVMAKGVSRNLAYDNYLLLHYGFGIYNNKTIYNIIAGVTE